MKLIKINQDHYVVVDDSEIKEGDWIYNAEREPSILQCIGKGSLRGWQKITHSTQPLAPIKELLEKGYDTILPINIDEVKELIGEVDVEKRIYDTDFRGDVNSYKQGYTQAIEDNKEKKWTDEDVIYFVNKSRETGLTAEYLMLSKQPKTEWEVELIDGQLKLK